MVTVSVVRHGPSVPLSNKALRVPTARSAIALTELRSPRRHQPARDALTTEHDIDTRQDLVQALRCELANALREHRSIDGDELRRVATESLGSPATFALSGVFPGAEAQVRLLVNGTHTTVASRLRFSALPCH